MLRRRITLLSVGLVAGLLVTAPAYAVIDHQPPRVGVTGPATPASGWFTSPVELVVGAADDSGIDPSSTLTLTGAQTGSVTFDVEEGAASAVVDIDHEGTTTVTWDVLDAYGNETRASRVVRLDSVAPQIQPINVTEGATLRQYADPGGAVSAFVRDTGSGLATSAVDGDVTHPDHYLVTDTPGAKQVTFTDTDAAGNTSTLVVHYTVTAYTRPTVTVEQITAPSTTGWYAGPVAFRIHGTPGQPGSTIARVSWGYHDSADGADGTDTLGQSAAPMPVRATDSNGITSLVAYTPEIHIDTDVPTLNVPQPADVHVGDVVEPVHGCSDFTSGIRSCAVTGDVVGGRLDTRTPGERTFTVTAVDLAGNTSSAQRSYTVLASTTPPSTTPPATTPPATTPPATTPPVPSTTAVRFTVRRRVVTASVTVASSSPASGAVTVYDGQRVVGTATVVGGSTTLRLARLRKGRHALRVVYAGSPTTAPSSTVGGVRLR